MATASQPEIVFVVGTGRSGTQLLSDMLACWPQAALVPETHFLVPLLDRYGDRVIDADTFLDMVAAIRGNWGGPWIELILDSAGMAGEPYREGFKGYLSATRGTVRQLTDAFFAYLYGPGRLIVDKTPHYGSHARRLRALWPGARFVHMVRDGVDAAASMQRHGGFQHRINRGIAPADLDRVMVDHAPTADDRTPPSLAAAVRFWAATLEATEAELAHLPAAQVLTVRYEDLVHRPEAEITRIAAFLGIDDQRRALARAATIPRAFPERSQQRRLSPAAYNAHYALAGARMARLGYPYEPPRRGPRGIVREVYRGRYALLRAAWRWLRRRVPWRPGLPLRHRRPRAQSD